MMAIITFGDEGCFGFTEEEGYLCDSLWLLYAVGFGSLCLDITFG
jgi:hypothetical protein